MKKIYRSVTDKKIAGVCGGLASYLNIDSTIIRLIFAFLGFTMTGCIAYIICWFIIPEEPADYSNNNQYDNPYNNQYNDGYNNYNSQNNGD